MNSKFFILFCTVAANYASFLQTPRAMIKMSGLNSIAYSAPIAQVALDTPAVGSSSQNVVRSFDGTVSQYAKAVDTAFSSVRKFDTRINNNVYSPAIQTKTIGHVIPADALLTTYAAPVTKAVTYSGPVAHVSFNGFGTYYGW